jgi:hypothetical protein
VLRGPTLELLNVDGSRLALLGLHHGRAIRWKQWEGDAILVDGRVLLEWLAERDVGEPLSEFQKEEEGERQRKEAWGNWVNAMPLYLRALPDETFLEVMRTDDWTSLLTAAAEAYPDMRERISTLFEWYAKGTGKWNSYPAWEQWAECLLLRFPQASLVDAAASPSLTESGLEGAARLFAGTTFQPDSRERVAHMPLSCGYSGLEVVEPIRPGPPVHVPEALRRRLGHHCQISNDLDKRQRGESAFGGAAPDI